MQLLYKMKPPKPFLCMVGNLFKLVLISGIDKNFSKWTMGDRVIINFEN